MKVLILFTFFLSACSSGQLKDSYLWKLEKDNKQSYFLATVDIGVTLDDLSSQVPQILADSSVVYFGFPLDFLLQRRSYVMAEILDSICYVSEESEKAKRRLPAPVWARIQELASANEPQWDIESISPLCALQIAYRYDSQVTKVSRFTYVTAAPELSVMYTLPKMARDQNKLIGSLDETADFRRSEMTACLDAIAVNLLTARYQQDINLTTLLFLQLQAFREGDGDQFKALSRPYDQQSCLPRLRNREWVPLIVRTHETQKSAFFIGGFHQINNDSVNLLDKLKEEGFVIEKMPVKR